MTDEDGLYSGADGLCTHLKAGSRREIASGVGVDGGEDSPPGLRGTRRQQQVTQEE